MIRLNKIIGFKALPGLCLVLVGFPSAAHCGSIFKTLPEMVDKEWVSHRIHPATYLSGGSSADSHLERYNRIRQHLYDHGLHPLVNIIAKPLDHEMASSFGLSEQSGLSIREFALKVGSYDVCKSSVKTVDSVSGASHVVGVIPQLDAVYPVSEDSWPDQEEAVKVAVHAVQNISLSVVQPSTSAISRCLYPSDGELLPAWKITMRSGRIPYMLYVGSAGIIDGDAMAFDVATKIRAYRSNSNDPLASKMELIDFTVDLNSDGFLTNQYFTTGFGNGASRKAAPFDATPSDPDHFNEQSSFAHVNRQFQFVSQYGYAWTGPKPLKVFTSYTAVAGRESNAQYIPFDGESGPYIIIGPGKTGELTNLATDSDVVSHEFGHHVVYSSVTDIPSGSESLIIHEGMADALTFYASGDNCLAESICPRPEDKRGFCQVLGKCLRTADNSIKYRDSVYQAIPGAHARGQVVSGLFADLRKSGAIPSDNLNRLIIGTVSYLPREANIKALITALLDADFAMFQQQYSSVIKSAAAARGMGVEDLSIDLKTVDGVAPTSEGSTKKKSNGNGFLGLCSVGSGAQNTASALGLIGLLFLPLWVQLLRKSSIIR